MAIETGAALPARRNGADHDPLSDGVTRDARPEFGDHANRLMTDGQSLPDRVIAPEDVDIGSTNRGGRYFYESLSRPGCRNRLLCQLYFSWPEKYCCFHGAHGQPL
jgi:hypothetical protein